MLLHIFGWTLWIFGRKEVDAMAVIYATLIVKGNRTFESVPELIKTQVREILIDLEMEALITE